MWDRIWDWFSIFPPYDVLFKAGKGAKQIKEAPDYYGLDPLKAHRKRVKLETAAFQSVVPTGSQTVTFSLAIDMGRFRYLHRRKRGSELYCMMEENACVAHNLIQVGWRYKDPE